MAYLGEGLAASYVPFIIAHAELSAQLPIANNASFAASRGLVYGVRDNAAFAARMQPEI